MTNQELISLFDDHIQDLPDEHFHRSNNIATLYASDDVEVDTENNRIKFPVLGWVAVGCQIPKNLSFEWIALYKENGVDEMGLGKLNPFFSNALPKRNGKVSAVPWNVALTPPKDCKFH